MRALCKPTVEDLTPLLAEATENGKILEETWRKTFLDNLAGLLKRRPLDYRGFGPYWWLLKAMFVEQGITRFGGTVDAAWREALDYGNPTTNLLAAYAHYDMAFARGLRRAQTHAVEYEDGETGEYVLIDEEMELLGLGTEA